MERAMQLEWRALSFWERGEGRVGAWLDGLRFLHLNLKQKFACCLGALQSKIQRSRLSQEILRITL
jgi:hypothetical protein